MTVPLICTSPLEADKIGILKPGALDHGLVPAVAVTVCTLESVTVPLVTVTGPVAVTVIWLLSWIRPEDTLTTGILKPGADDHGFVPAVAVTVGVPLI